MDSELNVRLIIFIAVYSFLELQVLCAKMSRLEQKVEALDNLVRGEMFLLNEKIDTQREEMRASFMKKLDETMENIENLASGTTATDKLHMQIHNEGKTQTLEGQIKQMSGQLVRLKRGIMEEKKARKTDVNALITQLSRIEENQHEIIEVLKGRQNELSKYQVDLINSIEDIRNKTETYHSSSDVLIEKIVILEQKLGTQEHELTSAQRQLLNINNTAETLVQIANNISKASYFVASVLIKKRDIPYIQDCQRLEQSACLEGTLSTLYDYLNAVTEFQVTLAGGGNNREGRVEIDYQGRHGTVCDDHWGNDDAKVVCRMLGFTGGTVLNGPGASDGHSFGEGTGEILLDSVACTGDELSLFACKHSGIGVHDCSHHEDAGVRCDP